MSAAWALVAVGGLGILGGFAAGTFRLLYAVRDNSRAVRELARDVRNLGRRVTRIEARE